MEKFTKELRDNYSIEIVQSIEDVVRNSDAILLESVDGAVHYKQLKEIIAWKKPVFVDKPFSLNTKEAKKMVELANRFGTPLMSSSALRYSESLTRILQTSEKGEIIGADCFGPMDLNQAGYFWYGIHAVEMLFTILGQGAKSVKTVKTVDHDVLTAVWKDGRIGTVRGNRKGNNQFGAVIHFEKGSEYVNADLDIKPYYASLLEQIMIFFTDENTRVPLEETTEIIRFLEAATESSFSGEEIII
ncbi:Predicted dehydrogenase [Psychrobacillus sp. OK028]|uniref:Gfo/Idh/MocA family protein n=1 Tax=Psychrobacillus sp. OK028 TaxID=1884359 RepID=UPI00087ED911|nr:Predicted dehydrogenase [Psychrobacillus sp. OK028]